MKRVLAILLVLLMLVPLAACGGGNDPGKGGGGENTDVTYLDTIGDKDFGGEEIIFSMMESYAYEIYKEEEEPDACDEEIYNRNSRLEERFNVTLTPLYKIGDGADAHTAGVRNTIMNGEDSFDVSMVQIWQTGPLITSGMFLNLREYVPYVKDSLATTDWWSADINNAYTIYGKQYVAVSDINLSAIKTTWCYLFNKGRVEDEGIASSLGGYESMYDVVRAGKWTLDTVFNLIKNYYNDNTTSGAGIDTKDDYDTYGLLTTGEWWMEIQTSACGVQLIKNDGETTPEVTPFTDFNAIVEGISKIGLAKGFYKPTSVGALDKFADGSALMLMTTFQSLESDTIHDSDVEFGVLPMPKAANQTAYHAGSQDAMTSIEVPTTSYGPERLERIGALLEALSAESHRVVLPAYYDVILKHKNTRDEESIEMIELIYKGRLYNFAQIHSQGQEQLWCNDPQGGSGTGLFYLMRTLGKNPSMVSSWWESSQDLLESRLAEIIEIYANGY